MAYRNDRSTIVVTNQLYDSSLVGGKKVKAIVVSNVGKRWSELWQVDFVIPALLVCHSDFGLRYQNGLRYRLRWMGVRLGALPVYAALYLPSFSALQVLGMQSELVITV